MSKLKGATSREEPVSWHAEIDRCSYDKESVYEVDARTASRGFLAQRGVQIIHRGDLRGRQSTEELHQSSKAGSRFPGFLRARLHNRDKYFSSYRACVSSPRAERVRWR